MKSTAMVLQAVGLLGVSSLALATESGHDARTVLRGQPQVDAGAEPAVVPGDAPGATSPEALNMDSWMGLRTAMNKISEQVRQVLLARSDLGMLQEDLKTQEGSWRNAEAELRGQITSAGLRAKLLGEEVAEGAHIHADVSELEKSLQQQLASNAAAVAAFEFEKAQVELEEKQLRDRVQELKEFQVQARAKGEAELQKARDGQFSARQKASELKRTLNLEKDKLATSQTKLKQEVASWDATVKEATSSLESLNYTADNMRQQLLPKGEVVAQLASMKMQLEQETQSIIKVQEEAVQQAAECRRKWQMVEEARYAEQAKADARRKEMLPICSSATQERELLQKMLVDSCGGAATAGPAPAPALAAF